MRIGIALFTLALLAVLAGSAWRRRSDLEPNGESGAMVIGLALCVAAVAFTLLALSDGP